MDDLAKRIVDEEIAYRLEAEIKALELIGDEDSLEDARFIRKMIEDILFR